MIEDKTKKEIEKLIGEIESKSAAEIVCAVSDGSERYRYVVFLYAALSALILPFLLLALKVKLSGIDLIWMQIALFLFVSFSLEYSDIKYSLIPKKMKYNRCNAMAYYQFHKIGVDKTSNHKAILILVCLKERYIKIVADSEIDKRVGYETWQKIVQNFINSAKKGELDKALIDTVKECGEILQKEFPRDKDAKNELSNEVIEI
ncbi:MAG: hypothetical protein GXO12_03915 [Epsilonproteobacteria bacterium]|nr:hypothetical protein [Campylobacterota bacterium]